MTLSCVPALHPESQAGSLVPPVTQREAGSLVLASPWPAQSWRGALEMDGLLASQPGSGRGAVGGCQGDQSTALQTCCRWRCLNPQDGGGQAPRQGGRGGGGRETKPLKSAIRRCDGQGLSARSGLLASSPILGLGWQGLPWGSNQADLSRGSLGPAEAGVLVAVGFPLCIESLPGERCRGGQRLCP